MPSLPPHGPLELGLVHLGPALDVPVLRLVVELVVGATARPAMRAQTTSSPGGDVLGRGPAGFPGLPGAGPFLVHGASRDLLSGVLVLAPVKEPFLDVVILPFALVAARLLRHVGSPFRYRVPFCHLPDSKRTQHRGRP